MSKAEPVLRRLFSPPVVVLALLACGCHGQNPTHQEATALKPVDIPDVPVTVAVVEMRPVQRRVSVVGTLHGFERITVTPKVEGRVQALHFDVGDRVKPGTVLVEIDPTDYRLAVEEAQQLLNQELSKLDLQKSPLNDFDIEQLPAVESARLLFENAEQEHKRQQNLLSKGASSEEVFQRVETQMKVAAAALRLARQNARTILASIKHQEAVLSVAQQKLAETQVKAPVMGSTHADKTENFVISKKMASVGEMVRAFPSTPVFELVADDVLKLHVMVPERYLAQVKMDLTVEVTVDAYPKEVFLGKVARINPTVDSQSRSFDVEAHFPNQDHRLKHGGFAKADVIVGTSDKALTVPLEAVSKFAGVTKVFKVVDGVAQEVEITTGTQQEGWVEAVGALQAGDKVVTSGQSKLAKGTKVVVRQIDGNSTSANRR